MRPRQHQIPTYATSLTVAALSALALLTSAWLAVQSGAETKQTGLALWFNQPPQPIAFILTVSNPLLRPIPLAALSVLLIGWILWTARVMAVRLEVLRALIVGLAISEVGAQALKRLAMQPRPLSVIPGLDQHGYPGDPLGNAYPSAHTALAVAAVTALWPWLSRPQRVVGVAFAVLIAANRLYIGAHWPLDIIGGAAVGMLAGCLTWVIATRWPLTPG